MRDMTAAPASKALSPAVAPPSAVVELIDVDKTYFKPDGSVAVRALDNVSVKLERGSYIAIMGPSGSGKSTLMNVLGCLDRPTKGRYLLDGIDVAQMGDEELSRVRGKKIGFVFQAFNLIPQLTIEENVEVPLLYQGVSKGKRRERALELIEKVGLSDRLGHRPSELSGGQQQRAAIARSLVNEPVILFADEPTGNLDTKTGEDILRLFEDLHRAGMTIAVVTHDPNISRRCERVIRLLDGKIESDIRQTPS